jgi:hypothetical protein
VLGRPLVRCGDRIGLFSLAQIGNASIFDLLCIAKTALDGAFDSKTGDAQEHLLSSGNNGDVKNIVSDI